SFEKLVLPALLSQDIGVLGMKSMGGGVLLKSGAVTPVECLRYALSLPTSVVITGIDKLALLDQAVDVATGFTPMSEAEKQEVLARSADFAATGAFELFKTSSIFDATAKHPEWLREEPAWVKEAMA